MSHEGKLKRGKQYADMETMKGYPNGITSNPAKMADLNYYLDSIKKKEEPKPSTIASNKKKKEE